MSPPRRIVVGVDGSGCAAQALGWAIDVACALDGEVVAVHALGLLVHTGSGELAPAAAHRDEVRAVFERDWCRPLHASTVAHRHLLVDGNPVTALLAAANEQDADLVAVGTRGAGGFPGLQLGSTSHQLVQHAELPVVVVPPAWTPSAAPPPEPPGG